MSKEEIRARRKEAYQAAKTRRAQSPKYIELKERQKAYRQAQYQKAKAWKQAKKDAKRQKELVEKKLLLFSLLKTADELEN
jgi:hypothetical protein